MSMHRLSGCPSCAEPLEEGDRFCGVCGYAVSAPPPSQSRARPAAHPPGEARPSTPDPAAGSAGPGPGPDTPANTASRYTATRPDAQAATNSAAGSAGPGPDTPAGTASGYNAPRPDTPAAVVPAGGYAGPDTPAGGYAAAVGYGGAPAPGWGSVAGAAPTLVGDPAGWSAAATPQPPPYGDTGTPWNAGRTPHDDTDPGHDRADDEREPRTDPDHGSGDGRETRYDLPGGTGAAPAHEPPYSSPPQAPQAPQAPQGDGGKTCVACRAGRVDTDGYCEHCGHAQPRERDHVEEELGSVAAVSDRGLRHHRNEDSFAVAATALPDGSAATVAIVCDGVSSASRPDEASAAAAGAANEALLDALPRGARPKEAMHEAILAAAAAVNALAPEVPGAQNAPACTLVGAVVSGGLLTIGWVGDSRAYWVPDDRTALSRRLTEDDSWAAQMVAAGLMGEAEAYADVRAHAITGWLGADAYELEPHTASFKPDHPGVVVVCTDGLWNYAESAQEMAQVLPADAAVRPLHSAQVLVGHALDGGGHDNVTVAVVPFAAPPAAGAEAEPQPEPEADPRTQA